MCAGARGEPVALRSWLALHVDAGIDRIGGRRCAPAAAGRGADGAGAVDWGLRGLRAERDFGSMVKPLTAGLAARNGVLAALLAAGGFTASGAHSMAHRDSLPHERRAAGHGGALGGLGSRWEIRDRRHPPAGPVLRRDDPSLDALVDLRREHGFEGHDVQSIQHHRRPGDAVGPDLSRATHGAGSQVQHARSVPRRLPCSARVGTDTFDGAHLADAALRRSHRV